MTQELIVVLVIAACAVYMSVRAIRRIKAAKAGKPVCGECSSAAYSSCPQFSPDDPRSCLAPPHELKNP